MPPRSRRRLSGHDQNIDQAEADTLLDEWAGGRATGLGERVRALTLEVYGRGAGHAEACGIVLADSFDKQFVRDWLEGVGWDKRPPAPALPPQVAEGTAARYREACLRLTGRPLDDWLAEARG